MSDDLIPPSFTPTHPHNSGSDGQVSPQPPSFTPSRTRSQKPSSTPSPLPPSVARTQPDTPSRSARQVQGSTSTPRSTRPAQPARSAAPQTVAPRRTSTSSTSSISSTASASPTAAAAVRPTAHPNKPRKSTASKVAKGLGIFIILLIIIALVLCFWLYSWVNGQLVHFDALSSSPAGSAETWLILGSDVRDGTPGSGAVGSTNGDRTDTIMVLIKPKSGPAALISIPRDSYVVVNDTGMKINAVAETVGWSGLTSEVENLIGTKIDHVVRVGFAGVQNVVDALGGVRLCYDSDVDDAYSGLTWKAGCHTVDGKTALEFSRMRYSDPTGDIGRTARQRQVIQAVAAKAGSKETLTNVPKAKSVIEALLKTVKVDEETSPWTLLSMVDAFKAATSKDGITGTPYMTDVNYTPSPAVGSTVRLDDKANPGLFRQLVEGSHKAGTVGGMSN